MKTNITISIDTNELSYKTDEYLALLWHVGQANPAAYGDKQACFVVEAIGFEIIARFLRSVNPELRAHQARDFKWTAVSGAPSSDHVIITGPQGCGKTRYGQALAQFYGMKQVAELDDDRLASSYPHGTLLLTNQPRRGAIEFDVAMRAAGLTSLAGAA